MVVKDVSNLKFKIIKNEDFEKNREIVENAFDLIYERWTVANRALNINQKVYSDSLLFSDICGLMDGDEWICLLLTKKGLLSSGYFSAWSYFESFGEDVYESLKKHGDFVQAWRMLSVARIWGKTRTNYHPVTILLGLMSRQIKKTGCDFAIAIANNGLNMNVLCKELGFDIIATKNMYNTTGDVIVIKNHGLYRHHNEEINLIIEKIWREYENTRTVNREVRTSWELDM